MGSDPDPAGEVYSDPPHPWLDLRGPSSKGRKGKWREREKENWRRDGRGKEKNDLPYDLGDLEMTWLL